MPRTLLLVFALVAVGENASAQGKVILSERAVTAVSADMTFVDGAWSDGSLLLLDRPGRKVLVYDSAGALTRSFGVGKRGAACGRFLDPVGIAASQSGIFVFDLGDNSITRFAHNGTCEFRTRTNSEFTSLGSFTNLSDGKLLITGRTRHNEAELLVVGGDPTTFEPLRRSRFNDIQGIPLSVVVDADEFLVLDPIGLRLHLAEEPPRMVFRLGQEYSGSGFHIVRFVRLVGKTALIVIQNQTVHLTHLVFLNTLSMAHEIIVVEGLFDVLDSSERGEVAALRRLQGHDLVIYNSNSN